MNFKERLKSGQYIIFDGGMGTMLQAAGIPTGILPEEWNLTNPEAILEVHRAYVRAGSDVVTTNTFGANARKFGSRVPEIVKAAVDIARRSGAEFVAQDIGPCGAMLKPLGDFEFDDAYNLFKEQVLAGVEAGTDVFIIETMTDLLETKAAVLAVRENSDIPVIASLSYEKNGRTFLGVSAAAAVITLCGLGVDAVGMNCSLGPADIGDIVETICRYSAVPVIVQANAGLPESVDGRTVYNVRPEDYTDTLGTILEKCRREGIDKVRILGGCCGTNPDFIAQIRKLADAMEESTDGSESIPGISAAYDLSERAAVCSARMLVDYDNRSVAVGERLNPTGKKKISAALREENYDLLVDEALAEYECGAQILDVNAGLPDIDEERILVNLINDISGACPLPLQIDTTDSAALEAAVRHYSGKPIINSVNGKEESMSQVLPIAAKYGAAVICLTLDENGIPARAEQRLEIARRIMLRAEEYGIPKKNLIVDGLVMTVSTNQAEAATTLETVRLVRRELGLNTCLGVSNISFGLPNRELVNAAFLAEAFANGLNLAIIDPTKERYMQTVYAHRVLSGEDEASTDYIAYCTAHPLITPNKGNTGDLKGGSDAKMNTSASGGGEEQKTVADMIISGNRSAIADKTRELLETMSAMELVNKEFIPALDRVGELYEQGSIFLPQLMSAAETAKKGFDVIKASSTSGETGRRMKILLATVKGDIHDIGKNIVKMLLENYGYTVIDLGKDVDPQLIVDEIRAQSIPLVGLSALMTTTVRSMKDTIDAVRAAGLTCKIMVGGAVLNEKYAAEVGADFYAKDAAESARIAQQVELTVNSET